MNIGDSKLFFAKGRFKFSGSRIGTLYTCVMHVEKPLGAHSLSLVENSLLIKTWHECMGHLNWDTLKSVRSSNNPPLLCVRLDTTPPPTTSCKGCIAGKAKRQTFKPSGNQSTQSTEPIECIHADLMGPMEPASLGGQWYVCMFTCNYTSHVWVYFLKSKDKTLITFKVFVHTTKKLTGHMIKFFHSDRGGEFMSEEFGMFLEEHGITQETSAP